MLRIKNFFRGQVTFHVNHLPVSCLNRLKQFHITDIKIHEEQIIFNAPLVYAAAIKKLVNNFDWQAHENHNFFRGINYLLNHFFVVITALIGLIAFIIADMGIYRVKVISDDYALNTAVYEHLNHLGVKKFVPKNQINRLDLANDLVTNFPNIAHAHVKISGNTLLVNLSTAKYQSPKIKTNIYAQYDAVIKSVTVYSGQPVISIGDVVRKGDLLVENAYEGSVVIIGEVGLSKDDQIIRLDIVIN